MLIGTPGPHTWKGNLFLFTIAENFLDRDNNIYHAPMQDASPVNKYSYLGTSEHFFKNIIVYFGINIPLLVFIFTGMSVAAGTFFGEVISYAAGAPRSNGTGQVVLLSKRENVPVMSVDLILDGEQFASSYGYEITSADVNGDK